MLSILLYTFRKARGGVIGALTFTLPGATSWFIKAILGCYFLFFLIFFVLRISGQWKQALLSAVILAYVAAAIAIGADNVWWSSVLCFPLGVFYAANRERVDCALKKKTVMLSCFVSAAVFYLSYVKISMVFHVPAALLGCLALLIVNNRAVCDGKLLRGIGVASYEIYLIHSGFVAAIYTGTLNNMQVCIIYAASILGALALHKAAGAGNKILSHFYRKVCG